MRTIPALFLALLAAAAGSAQAKDKPAHPDKDPISFIKSYIDGGTHDGAGHQLVTGFDEKRIIRMGDASAVAIVQVLDEEGAKPDKAKSERILDVLHMAFERPSVVPNPADRKPTAAFQLLDRLKQASTNSDLNQEIESVRSDIIANRAR
jgi:hypothetical protein